MTSEQATAIRIHLIKELNANGFSDIVTEVNTRLEEDYEEEKFERSPRNLLAFFLTESVEVLNNLSNRDFDGVINRLNKFTSGDNKIGSISVELLNQGESNSFNLRELPDYKKVVIEFQEILEDINKEN